MGWVVTSWKIEAVTELIGAATARELADAVALLAALEAFGAQTRDQVAAQRDRLRPARIVIPEARTPVVVHRRGRERATLHDSPLQELFAAAGRRAKASAF